VQHGARVRVESDNGRDSARGARSLNHSPHNQLMAQMQAIENAERQDSGARYLSIIGSVK
jgi:hypothetical protein